MTLAEIAGGVTTNAYDKRIAAHKKELERIEKKLNAMKRDDWTGKDE